MTQWLAESWGAFWVSDAPLVLAVLLFAASLAITEFRGRP